MKQTEKPESDYTCPAVDDGHRFYTVDSNPGLRFRSMCERCGHVISRMMSN